tara:strand:+ start:2297 stop:2650 length:354 start_codon:yes stop_codon:yes gene_type:complete
MAKKKSVSVSKKTKDAIALDQRLEDLDKPDFFGTQEFDESGDLLDETRSTTKLLRLENRLELLEGQQRSKSEQVNQSGSVSAHKKKIEDLKEDIEEAKDRIRADETMRHHAENWMGE